MEKKLKKLIGRLLDTAYEAAKYSDEDRRSIAVGYASIAERLIVVLIQLQQHKRDEPIGAKSKE